MFSYKTMSAEKKRIHCIFRIQNSFFYRKTKTFLCNTQLQAILFLGYHDRIRTGLPVTSATPSHSVLNNYTCAQLLLFNNSLKYCTQLTRKYSFIGFLYYQLPTRSIEMLFRSLYLSIVMQVRKNVIPDYINKRIIQYDQ